MNLNGTTSLTLASAHFRGEGDCSRVGRAVWRHRCLGVLPGAASGEVPPKLHLWGEYDRNWGSLFPQGPPRESHLLSRVLEAKHIRW